MAISESFYSRLVTWLKILLPLTALAILSTVFFLARAPDTERQLPFATPDGTPIDATELIANPSFSGVTSDGGAIRLEANEVRPVGEGLNSLVASELRGRIETPDGRIYTARASAGAIDLEARIATLSSPVNFDASSGLDVLAGDVSVRLDRIDIRSEQTALATTPFGRVTAGGFSVGMSDGGYLLVFNNGVELIYAP